MTRGKMMILALLNGLRKVFKKIHGVFDKSNLFWAAERCRRLGFKVGLGLG